MLGDTGAVRRGRRPSRPFLGSSRPSPQTKPKRNNGETAVAVYKNTRKWLESCWSPIWHDNSKDFLNPIRSRPSSSRLEMVCWDSVPSGSFLSSWKLSSPFLAWAPTYCSWVSEDGDQAKTTRIASSTAIFFCNTSLASALRNLGTNKNWPIRQKISFFCEHAFIRGFEHFVPSDLKAVWRYENSPWMLARIKAQKLRRWNLLLKSQKKSQLIIRWQRTNQYLRKNWKKKWKLSKSKEKQTLKPT